MKLAPNAKRDEAQVTVKRKSLEALMQLRRRRKPWEGQRLACSRVEMRHWPAVKMRFQTEVVENSTQYDGAGRLLGSGGPRRRGMGVAG